MSHSWRQQNWSNTAFYIFIIKEQLFFYWFASNYISVIMLSYLLYELKNIVNFVWKIIWFDLVVITCYFTAKIGLKNKVTAWLFTSKWNSILITFIAFIRIFFCLSLLGVVDGWIAWIALPVRGPVCWHCTFVSSLYISLSERNDV